MFHIEECQIYNLPEDANDKRSRNASRYSLIHYSAYSAAKAM